MRRSLSVLYGIWLLVLLVAWLDARQAGHIREPLCSSGDLQYRAAAELGAAQEEIVIRAEGSAWPPGSQRCVATAPGGQISDRYPSDRAYAFTLVLALAPLVLLRRVT